MAEGKTWTRKLVSSLGRRSGCVSTFRGATEHEKVIRHLVNGEHVSRHRQQWIKACPGELVLGKQLSQGLGNARTDDLHCLLLRSPLSIDLETIGEGVRHSSPGAERAAAFTWEARPIRVDTSGYAVGLSRMPIARMRRVNASRASSPPCAALLRALLQRHPNTPVAGQGCAPTPSHPDRRQHSSPAGPRRPTPPLRPDLISDRDRASELVTPRHKCCASVRAAPHRVPFGGIYDVRSQKNRSLPLMR